LGSWLKREEPNPILPSSFQDRLLLDDKRIEAMANSLREIAQPKRASCVESFTTGWVITIMALRIEQGIMFQLAG